MIIKTPRLELHPAGRDDLDDWLALDLAPGVLTHLTASLPTRGSVERDLARRLTVGRLHHGYGWWSIRHEGTFAGRCSLRPGPDGDVFNPEMGFRLLPGLWGRGLATEAAQALVEHGFTGLGVSSVVGITMASNTAARRVMEKAGLRVRSTSPLGGQLPGWELGQVHLRITLAEWLDGHDDVRRQLHDMQAAALRQRDAARLEALRSVGTRLAAAEAGGAWASTALVRQLAVDGGVLEGDPPTRPEQSAPVPADPEPAG